MNAARGRILLVLGVIVLSVTARSARQTAAATAALGAQSSTLSNGLVVVADQHPDEQLESIAVAVRAGSRDEAPSFEGGAHWLEHLLFLGSEHYPSQDVIFSTISASGGSMNAISDSEATTYFATIPAAKFGVAVDVLSDMLVRPLFPEDAAERERGVVLDEIGDSSYARDDETFAQALLGPALNPVGGTAASVKQLTLADAIAFKNARYVAGNMVVGAVGPLTLQQVLAAVSPGFSNIPAGPASITPLPPPADGLRLTAKGGYSSETIVGLRLPPLSAADTAAVRVLDAILDIPGTRMSDAFDASKQLFGGSTAIGLLSDAGIWLASGYGNSDDVVQIVESQIQRLQNEPVSDAELRAATQYLAGRTLIRNEFVYIQARRLAMLTLFGAYLSEEEEAQGILAVTAADVQRVARTYFPLDAFSTLTPSANQPSMEGGL